MKTWMWLGAVVGSVFLLSRKASAAPGKSPQRAPPRNTPPITSGVVGQGAVSFYGPGFHGRQTANQEIFDQEAMTCASRTLPFNTLVEVEDLGTGKTVVVRVNDRGPYVGDRILDLSVGAARKLGILKKGLALNARLTAVDPANGQSVV